MIVVPEPGRLVCFTQPDHARFAGELAALWRLGGLPDHPRRSDILFAAREHDNGWREADAAPRLDRSRGRPHDFRTLPFDDRAEIWRRGIDRFAGAHPYAALLIAYHAELLHRHRRDQPGLEGFFQMLEERRLRLLEITGASEEQAIADYRFVSVTDRASLIACCRGSEPFEREVAGVTVRGSFRDGALHLDPFPLAGATTFRVPCRSFPTRDFQGDADLAVELASARWTEQTLRVVPG